MKLPRCENPLFAYRLKGLNPLTGRFYRPIFDSCKINPLTPDAYEQVAVPCGRCLVCQKRKSRDLLVRAWCESRCHTDNTFVTLTVDDEHLEEVFPSSSLVYRPFQLFMKRLRKKIFGSSKGNFRYLVCGEYGERSLRPHYHAIIFGLKPDNLKPVFRKPSSDDLFGHLEYKTGFLESDDINKCWPFGNVYLGSVTPNSIAYVSGYTLKSQVLGRDDDWYAARSLAPEFARWSRCPGLGLQYLTSHWSQIYPIGKDLFGNELDGSISFRAGNCVHPPRYFFEKLLLHDPQKFANIMLSKADVAASADDIARNMSFEECEKELAKMASSLETLKYNINGKHRF